MKKICVCVQKGGAGKTTLVSHLGVAIERAGDGPAVLIDTDPQQTLVTWWNLRKAEEPKLSPVAVDQAHLAALEASGFKYCLIDTPPALTKQNFQIVKNADLVIVPTQPSPTDLWTLGATLDLIRAAGVPFVFALTHAKANARSTAETIAALSAHGRVLPSIIGHSVKYPASMTDGRTVLEVYPKEPAAQVITDLWDHVKNLLSELANSRKGEFAPRKQEEAIHA
jgi:chromosome partitioning protein